MTILAALETLGIDYVVRGDEAFARCPAHRELHPSWSINIDSSIFNVSPVIIMVILPAW